MPDTTIAERAGEDGSLTFVWPSRFQPNPAPGDHTMKEACWKVLADLAKSEDDVAAAAKGLPVREIARQIEAQQLRITKSATIVEGSVAGALSRDSLFAYVAPGTYALQVCVFVCGCVCVCVCVDPNAFSVASVEGVTVPEQSLPLCFPGSPFPPLPFKKQDSQ